MRVTIALKVLLFLAVVALAVSSCGGVVSGLARRQVVAPNITPEPGSPPPAGDETEAGDPGTSGEETEGGDAGGGEDLSGQSVWWVNPDTGEGGYIIEGYASIGLEYFPDWVFDPPLQDSRLPERIDYELALSLGGQ